MSEQEIVFRDFPVELTVSDGRTVDVRIVPYEIPTQVSDGGPVYREEWARGAFDEQLVAGHRLRVLLNFEHEQGIRGVIGKGISLRSEPDGLHGSFKLHSNESGNTALELIHDGILGGVSLEAYPKTTETTAQGVVRRVRAHLRNVALCREPAFKESVILAVREAPQIAEELQPIDLDFETVERCRRLGIELPQRYQAHPDETDTPAQTGTSENGTRRPQEAATRSEGKDERNTE